MTSAIFDFWIESEEQKPCVLEADPTRLTNQQYAAKKQETAQQITNITKKQERKTAFH
jgi:hypothetical protein